MTTAATEQRCQNCGGRNVSSWWVDSDRYNLAVDALSIPRGWIICPGCFEAGHMLATGMVTSWELRPSIPFTWVEQDAPEWAGAKEAVSS